MAGMFDDLLSDAPNSSGLFDDLLADKPAPYRPAQDSQAASEAYVAPEPTQIERANKLNRGVAAEYMRLKEINPGASPDSLGRLATERYLQSQQPQPAPMDRVQQYVDKADPAQFSDGGLIQNATRNAAFDQSLQNKNNQKYQKREADPVTGLKISESYNPNTAAENTAKEAKSLADLREAVVGQGVAQEMNPVLRGITKGGVQSVGLTGAAGAYVGDLIGYDDLKRYGLALNDDASKIANQLTLSKNASDISSVGEFGDWLAENGGYVAYQAAEALLTGGLGSIAGKQVGKEAVLSAVAMGANNLRQTLGSVYADAVEEAKATGKPMPSLLQIAAGAVGSAAVDTFADKIGIDALTATGFKGNVMSRMAKSIGTQVGVQGGTEALQLIPEDLGAGKDPFREGAAKRFFDEAAVGALGGGGPGIAGGIRRAETPIAIPSAETMARDRGFLVPEKISFADPAGPASQAGITPVTIPVAPNVSTPSASTGVSARAADGGSNLSVPSVGDTGLAPTVGRGLGGAAGGDVANVPGGGAVSQQSVQPTASVNPIPRTSDSDLLSRLPVEQELNAADVQNTTPAASSQAQATPTQAAASGASQSTAATGLSRTGDSQVQPAGVGTPIIWPGRSGNGYDTIEAANQALDTRTKKDPELNWKVEQRPDGKYQLSGLAKPTTREQAVAEQQRLGVADQTDVVDTAEFGGEGFSVAPQLPKETVGELRKQQSSVEQLAAAIGSTGADASGIEIVTPKSIKTPAQFGAAAIVKRFAAVVKTAFGLDTISIRGIGALGVAHSGNVYANIDEIAAGGQNSMVALAIGTIGHEAGHSGLERSKDPEDRKAYANLKELLRAYYQDGVVDKQLAFENASAAKDGSGQVTRDYAENEVIQNINGAMWLDPKFWGRMHDIDNGSTMRRVAYRFMQAATKMIEAAKGTDLDIDTLVTNRNAVREIVAKTWAEKAMRQGKVPMSRTQIAKMLDTLPTDAVSDAAFKRKGVIGEVAPNPDQAVAAEFDAMQGNEKEMATRDIAKKIVQKLFDDMQLRGWSVAFSSGTFEGKENPNFVIEAADGATSAQIDEVTRALGYVLDQKAMVSFDESNTTDGNQSSFVKIELPSGISAARVSELRKHINEKTGLSGDTLRGGALVFGNFTGYSDKPLTDEQFRDALKDAITSSPDEGSFVIKDVERFESNYIEPANKEGYLEGTRYGNSDRGREDRPQQGGVDIRRGQGRDFLERLSQEAGDKLRQWIDSSASGRERVKRNRELDTEERAAADSKRSGAVEYGKAGPNSVQAVGKHYSKEQRKSLSSAFYGSGLKGAESDRLSGSQNSDIRSRIYFYVDSGNGVKPEAGVGSKEHIVKLNNLYDANKDPLGIWKNSKGETVSERLNNQERTVMRAGFDGYLADTGATQKFAVLIGKHEIPLFKRRTKQVEDYNDIGNINELGNFNLDADYANSTKDDFSFPDLSAADAKLDAAKPTEAEMAQRLRDEQEDAKKFKMLLARELEESGFSVVGTPKLASTKERNFAEVKPADLKQAGLMAEEAYPDLDYSEDPSDPMVDRAYFVVDGKRYRATISSSSPKIDQGAFEANAKKDAKGFMSGYELGGLSEQAKKDWNKRFAASADLIRRNFDIFTSVPAKARDNVLATWKAISQNPDAFEFGKANEAKGKNAKEVAQDIADKMMAGGRYKVKIGSPDYHRGDSDFSIMITDTKTGAEGSADVEFWMREKEVTMHTHELDKGSGMGKPVYQIGQAFADKFKARINADGILLGVNNYRRTEQMFSGMLRSGNYDTMQPGVGQRIYGWNERAKTQEQQDRNMVRTALAMARNVQEFVPDIQKFGFDLATNKFYFKDKPDTMENRLMAGVEIKRILSNSDVRVASISRSTLARAAITFEAMDGKEIDASKVAEPVLYKRKTTAEDLHKEIPKSPYRKLAIEIYKSDRQDSQTRVDAVGGFFDKRAGGRKDWTNPADVTAAVKQGVEEVKFMLTQEKSGLDWYEQDIARAFKETQRFIPSLKSESQRRLFSAVAGIKSPQTNARDNWHIAAQGFAHLKSTGTLSGVNPETGSLWQGGPTSTTKKKQLEMLNSMIQDIGESAATDWLFSEHTVKELNAARKKWGNMGPGVDGKAADMWLGLRAFGPKIGPFVMNINGIHGVTVDIWMNRTFNRWFGSMLDDSGAMVNAPTEPQRKSITKMVERIAMQTGIKPYQVQSVLWFFEQGVYKRIGTNAESYGFSDGAKKYSDYRDGRGDSANGGGVESGQNVRGSNADEDGGAATGGALSFKRKQPPRAPGLPGESRFMAVRRKLQDQYIQIRELQDMLTARGGVVGEAQDVYRAEERMHGRAQELLTDFSRNQIEPFVAKAAKMGVSLDEIALYAYAKHAEERNAYIKSINPKIGDAGSGMSDAHAQNIIQMVKLAGDDQKFDELHQDLMGITATTRRVLLDEGLITQEEYDGWEGLYENYVPLRGFEDVNHETATPLRGTGRGFSMTGKESVKALGRTSKAGDILENILRDYERAVIRSEKNAVAKTFLDLATSNPDPALWEVQPVKTNRSFNKASGMVLMTNTPDTGDETIAIKVAGQQVRVKINDPLILRAMKQASKDETSQLERLLSSTLGVYTNLMRNTLTRYNPIFGAINAVRDSQMGAVSAYDVLGAEGAKLYAKYLPVAMAASWRQERNKANPNGTMDKWIQEMRFAGGTTGGYHMRDTSEITEAMRTLMLQAGATPNTTGEKVRASLAYQKAAAAMKWLEIVGSTSEDAARVAAYRAARELGKTPAEAASIAKNLTTNFNRKGEWGTTLNSLYLFFNAGVQGTTRVLEALGNRRVQYMMAGATAAAMALALLNAGQGDDDDGQNYWDKIPDFEKERNLIFMLPPGVEMDGAKQVGTRGRYIKIPVPYGINVFPVLGNQMADLVRYAKDPSQGVKPAKAAINLVSAVFGSINPFGGSMDPTNFNELAMAVSPTASDLGLQLGLGINSFGRPVGPEKSPFDDKPDSENFSARQAGTASQHVARWINSVTGGNEGRSGKVDIMPGTIDNFVRNTTGGLGVFLADTFVNLPTKIASPVEVTNRDVPLLRNFYGQIDEVTDVGLFYDRRATMTKEMKAAQAEMKLGVDVDYTPESVTMQTLGKAAEGYTKWMSALRKEEIAIAADDTLTKGDKMLKRRELEKQRGELAKSFNSMYNEEMKALK